MSEGCIKGLVDHFGKYVERYPDFNTRPRINMFL